MLRAYVGNLDARISEQELEDEFQYMELIRRIWVARKPSGYAFIDFDDSRDAQDANRDLDAKHKWSVELSHNSRGGGVPIGHDYGGGGYDLKCCECCEPGHVARKCRL